MFDATTGHGRERRGLEIGFFNELQIPAIRCCSAELANVAKVLVERSGQFAGFLGTHTDGRPFGQDQALVMKFQVDGIGTGPVMRARFDPLAKQAQRGKRHILCEPETVGNGGVESGAIVGRAGNAGTPAARQKGAQGRAGQVAEGGSIARLGPDQFGNQQGEAHGP